MNKLQTRLAQVAAFPGLMALSLAARAADGDLPNAVTQLTAVKDSLSGYATIFFAIALVSTGIMVGVKWIKRGKGAA